MGGVGDDGMMRGVRFMLARPRPIKISHTCREHGICNAICLLIHRRNHALIADCNAS